MKKTEFYKFCKKQNKYFLAKVEGIKKTFEYEGEKITIYFEKYGLTWECTEESTGLNVLFSATTYKEAISYIHGILSLISMSMKTKKSKERADILSKLKSELEEK